MEAKRSKNADDKNGLLYKRPRSAWASARRKSNFISFDENKSETKCKDSKTVDSKGDKNEEEWDSLDEEIEAFNRSRAEEMSGKNKLQGRKSKLNEGPGFEMPRPKSHAMFRNRTSRKDHEEEFVIEVPDYDDGESDDEIGGKFEKPTSAQTASNTCQNNDNYNYTQLHDGRTIYEDITPLSLDVTHDTFNHQAEKSTKKINQKTGNKNFETEHHSRSYSDKGPSGKQKNQSKDSSNHCNSYNTDHPITGLNKINSDLFVDLTQIKRNLTERFNIWNSKGSSIHDDESSLADQYQQFLPLKPNFRKISLPPLPINSLDFKPIANYVSPRKLKHASSKKKGKDFGKVLQKCCKLNPLDKPTRLISENDVNDDRYDGNSDLMNCEINSSRRGSLTPLSKEALEKCNMKFNLTKSQTFPNDGIDDDDDLETEEPPIDPNKSEYKKVKPNRFLKRFQDLSCNDITENNEPRTARESRMSTQRFEPSSNNNLTNCHQAQPNHNQNLRSSKTNECSNRNSSVPSHKHKLSLLVNDLESANDLFTPDTNTQSGVTGNKSAKSFAPNDWNSRSLADFWHETKKDLDTF